MSADLRWIAFVAACLLIVAGAVPILRAERRGASRDGAPPARRPRLDAVWAILPLAFLAVLVAVVAVEA